MDRIAEKSAAASPQFVSVVGAALTGLVAIALLAQLGEVTPRRVASVALFAAVFGIAYITKRPKEVLLFSFIFALTYNRQYFVLQGALGNPGTQGPYVIPADAFFFSLLGLWLYELIVLKRRSLPQGTAMWPWYLPFAFACTLSVLVASRVDWSLFELVRVAKVGLILWYTRRNLGPRTWWICVGALGAALSVQSVLGILEVAFHHSGVLWVIGLGSQDQIIPQALEAESFYGWTRAQATMNHPPNLACYLLLTVPLFVALAVTHPERSRRRLCALTAIVGLGGLGCTLSRFPIILMALMLFILLLGLAALRTMQVKHSIALLSIGILITAGAGVAFSDFITQRVNRDWKASVDQRLGGYRAALSMYRDGDPWLGVGLNNYRMHMLKYEPELEWIDKYESLALDMNVRFPAAPENAYLFVLAETGVVGLIGFGIYLCGLFYTGVRGVVATHGHYRAASLGLLIGFTGVLLQQSIDHSYWVDPILYSTALVMGLVNNANSVSQTEHSR